MDFEMLCQMETETGNTASQARQAVEYLRCALRHAEENAATTERAHKTILDAMSLADRARRGVGETRAISPVPVGPPKLTRIYPTSPDGCTGRHPGCDGPCERCGLRPRSAPPVPR